MAKTEEKGEKAFPEFSVDMHSTVPVNPKNIEPVYANNAALMTTAHDIRMVLAEVVSWSISQPPAVELRANIVMSPTHFKAFAKAVADTITSYEKAHGEIQWPPNQQKSPNIN